MPVIAEVTSNASFKRMVLRAPYPVVVDFWAEWCGPCRQLAPVLEELARNYQDRVRVVKVNVDSHHELAARYGVRSIPMVALFENGQPTRQSIGLKPLSALVRDLALD